MKVVQPPESIAEGAWGEPVYLAYHQDVHYEGTTPVEGAAEIHELSDDGEVSEGGGVAQGLSLGEETPVPDDASDSAPLVSPLSERASVVDDDTQVASGEEMEGSPVREEEVQPMPGPSCFRVIVIRMCCSRGGASPRRICV